MVVLAIRFEYLVRLNLSTSVILLSVSLSPCTQTASQPDDVKKAHISALLERTLKHVVFVEGAASR